MKYTLATTIVVASLWIPVLAAGDGVVEHHMLMGSSSVKWGPPPPVVPAGAKFAVIDGDPALAGPVTVRIAMPAGYKIPPHWHPTDEYVTVLSGSLSLGMGDTPDPAHATMLKAGGFAVAPAKMHHYASTKTGATIQLHFMGPFALTYVNPTDDPTHGAAK